MNELIPLILIGLICLVTGFVLGLLVSSLRAEKSGREVQDGTLEAQIKDSARPVERAAEQPLPNSTFIPASQGSLGRVDQEKPERPSLNPVSLLARSLQPDRQSRPAAPKSIASQVDEVLQEKLSSRSLDQIPADRRAIRLVELPGKGMVVLVGLDCYEGVEMVPEPEIRGLIRESVEEWEKRLASG